jgi:hypothetical protein
MTTGKGQSLIKSHKIMGENRDQSNPVQNRFPQKLQPEVARMSVGVVTHTLMYYNVYILYSDCCISSISPQLAGQGRYI